MIDEFRHMQNAYLIFDAYYPLYYEMMWYLYDKTQEEWIFFWIEVWKKHLLQFSLQEIDFIVNTEMKRTGMLPCPACFYQYLKRIRND